ncbi:hypothetical protein [Streptomyces sp. gCLA4]|uniref:hypothetical protein n=2 Tax=Streptomyces TaxID=1883 RepID=UPI0021809C0E|nr:hypothetical protein [Streptomyces sp. gCLA4]
MSGQRRELRLSPTRMTGWDISPFDPDGLRLAPLRPPVLPWPPRHGEDPADCDACRGRDEGIRLDDRWRLSRIGGVGVPPALVLHPRDHFDLADLPEALVASYGGRRPAGGPPDVRPQGAGCATSRELH